MCKKKVPPSTNEASTKSSFIVRMVLNIITIIYFLGFINFRGWEVVSLVLEYPIEVSTSVVAFLLVAKVTSSWNLLAILSMVAFVWITDDYLLDPIPSPTKETVVAITGANSGVGFETAKALAQFSSVIVIMGCRSVSKCETAAENIRVSLSTSGMNVIPMHLDLSSFDSVHQFVDSAKQSIGKPVDVLFNNAGYAPFYRHEPVNEYGLDPSFTSMHLSHHLLAELLVEWNPRLHLVSTSSGTHHACAAPFVLPKFLQFPFTVAPGCINEEYLSKHIHSAFNDDKYFKAKVANVLHISEFPLRHPESISIGIDLGWVGTSIQPFMSYQVSPTSLGWMRSASIGIYPMMKAILQPPIDRNWAKQGGINIGVLGQLNEPFSHPWWSGDLSSENMKQVAKKLWQKSTEILQQHGCTVCQ